MVGPSPNWERRRGELSSRQEGVRLTCSAYRECAELQEKVESLRSRQGRALSLFKQGSEILEAPAEEKS